MDAQKKSDTSVNCTTMRRAIRTVILYVEENMPDAKLIILSGMSKTACERFAGIVADPVKEAVKK